MLGSQNGILISRMDAKVNNSLSDYWVRPGLKSRSSMTAWPLVQATLPSNLNATESQAASPSLKQDGGHSSAAAAEMIKSSSSLKRKD